MLAKLITTMYSNNSTFSYYEIARNSYYFISILKEEIWNHAQLHNEHQYLIATPPYATVIKTL